MTEWKHSFVMTVSLFFFYGWTAKVLERESLGETLFRVSWVHEPLVRICSMKDRMIYQKTIAQRHKKAEQVTSIDYPLLMLKVPNYLKWIWKWVFPCIQAEDEIYRKAHKCKRWQTPTNFHWKLRARTTSGVLSRCSSLHLWAHQNLYIYNKSVFDYLVWYNFRYLKRIKHVPKTNLRS